MDARAARLGYAIPDEYVLVLVLDKHGVQRPRVVYMQPPGLYADVRASYLYRNVQWEKTYAENTVQFGNGPVCLDQIVGVRPGVTVQ